MDKQTSEKLIAKARATIEQEADAVRSIAEQIDKNVEKVVENDIKL